MLLRLELPGQTRKESFSGTAEFAAAQQWAAYLELCGEWAGPNQNTLTAVERLPLTSVDFGSG